MSFCFLSKEAKLCVNYSVNIQKGESVLIWGPVDAIPLINEIYREVIYAGGHPTTKIEIPGQKYIFYKEAHDHQLNYSNPFDLYYMQNLDVGIYIQGLSNTRELSNINPEKIKKFQIAQIELWKTFFQRERSSEMKWVVIPYPTEGLAQEANMSREELANLIEKTCLLDKPDPIAEWKSISQKQQKYCDYLENIDELHIIDKETDITMSVSGRKWKSSDGKKNLPDGEIFTSPIENSANGTIKFSFPSIYLFREIDNIVLKFNKGRVVNATADKGQDFLNKIIKISGAKRIGEIGIGMNYNMNTFVKNILFDEKIGGTIHLALGRGYPQTGSKNQSVIHWDLLCDMREKGKIYADGDLIYESGKFMI